jgi:hypothetical protein
VPIGWQLPAHYHFNIGMAGLKDAPVSATYLPAQLLAKQLRIP